MYLLNHVIEEIDKMPKVFTFHNVSIKSITGTFQKGGRVDFTFHNVSIKSPGESAQDRDSVYLYIPQCIY